MAFSPIILREIFALPIYYRGIMITNYRHKRGFRVSGYDFNNGKSNGKEHGKLNGGGCV